MFEENKKQSILIKNALSLLNSLVWILFQFQETLLTLSNNVYYNYLYLTNLLVSVLANYKFWLGEFERKKAPLNVITSSAYFICSEQNIFFPR